jgi:hypothetical protein
MNSNMECENQDTTREMTLAEWIHRLPPSHSARREYEELLAAKEEVLGGVNATHETRLDALELDVDRIKNEIRNINQKTPYGT